MAAAVITVVGAATSARDYSVQVALMTIGDAVYARKESQGEERAGTT